MLGYSSAFNGFSKIFRQLLQSHQVNAQLGLSSKTPSGSKIQVCLCVCVCAPSHWLNLGYRWEVKKPVKKGCIFVLALTSSAPRGFKPGPYLINAHQHPLYAIESYSCLELHSIGIAGLINRGDLGLWKISISGCPDILQIPCRTNLIWFGILFQQICDLNMPWSGSGSFIKLGLR